MAKQKEEIAERLSDAIVASMDDKQLRELAWDNVYREMADKSWGDLLMFAEDYSPDLLKEFPTNVK